MDVSSSETGQEVITLRSHEIGVINQYYDSLRIRDRAAAVVKMAGIILFTPWRVPDLHKAQEYKILGNDLQLGVNKFACVMSAWERADIKDKKGIFATYLLTVVGICMTSGLSANAARTYAVPLSAYTTLSLSAVPGYVFAGSAIGYSRKK